MRHISTRGEAPALGFTDVMLAGLARDGGLYVPETWPRLTREATRHIMDWRTRNQSRQRHATFSRKNKSNF